MTTLHEATGFGRQTEIERARPEEAENMNVRDRAIAGVAGSLFIYRAVAHPSIKSLLLGVGGGVILKWAWTGHCPLYQSLGVNTTRTEPHDFFDHGIHAEVSYTIGKSPEELFRFWRDFENLPRFMKHLESVKVLSSSESHWVAAGPGGKRVEWDAQIINEEPDRLIAWRSKHGADVDNAGSVRFIPAPGGRGSEVHVVIEYIPPGGRIGAAIVWLFGREPAQQVREDLRRFKQLMETGEIPTIEGQPQGTCK